MADNTFWIAALTGGTAVLASWVTSRGNTRAARSARSGRPSRSSSTPRRRPFANPLRDAPDEA
ncbi:hypothetical protein [Streptomyces malaysiensis]|uniref:hypothetical protein n=1 Tax=Streptomyces malaysiensis TaxID=92644 RepID=UPI00142EA8CF|nr:hypothetical protein [Streptomyces malaysiensis]